METVSQQTENQELTQEQISSHEQEMIAKADSAEAKSLEKDSNEFGISNEEGLLAGKYKTAEDLEKAYKELEAKLGINSTEETKEEEAPKEETPTTPTTEEEAKELTESKGIDFTELNAEYADKGELSDETYKKLAEAGINKEAVDSYIAGQEALAQQNVSKLHNSVGGEEAFNEMIEWASESLTETEKNTFNRMVKDEATAEFAIKGLHARFVAEGKEPKLLDGATPSAGNSGYQSNREMMKDMADPRYKSDSAFRELVALKVARSKF